MYIYVKLCVGFLNARSPRVRQYLPILYRELQLCSLAKRTDWLPN